MTQGNQDLGWKQAVTTSGGEIVYREVLDDTFVLVRGYGVSQQAHKEVRAALADARNGIDSAYDKKLNENADLRAELASAKASYSKELNEKARLLGDNDALKASNSLITGRMDFLESQRDGLLKENVRLMERIEAKAQHIIYQADECSYTIRDAEAFRAENELLRENVAKMEAAISDPRVVALKERENEELL